MEARSFTEGSASFTWRCRVLNRCGAKSLPPHPTRAPGFCHRRLSLRDAEALGSAQAYCPSRIFDVQAGGHGGAERSLVFRGRALACAGQVGAPIVPVEALHGVSDSGVDDTNQPLVPRIGQVVNPPATR